MRANFKPKKARNYRSVRLPRWDAVLVICTVISGLSACSGVLVDPQVPLVPTPQNAPEFYAPPLEEEYELQVGDELQIRSYYDPQLNQDVTVRVDGKISLLLLQDVPVIGKSPAQLGNELSSSYNDLVGASDILVSLSRMADASIYVGGEVRQQSKQPLNGPITLVQAITAAGGFLPTANTQQVLVLRRGTDSRFVGYQIDTDRVLVNQIPDIYLQRFDVVHVPLSQVGHVGRFVDQYINRIIPEALRFTVGYTWLDDTRDNPPGSVQVLGAP